MFAIPIRDRWLVHAPLHGVSALMNAAAVGALRHSGGQVPTALQELGAALAAPTAAEPRPHRGTARPEFLGLIPTRSCNLSCHYCGFGASDAPRQVMELSRAVTAVDWMMEQAARRRETTAAVHFFGGEPLCAREVVEVAVHRTRARAAELGLRPVFEIATNGCCDEATARFVGDYFDTVVLSLDGTPEFHDRHRPFPNGHGSYEPAARTARLLRDSPARLCLRLCVTGGNVSHLEEMTAALCDEFRPTAVDFEGLQPTARSDQAGLRPPDPWVFTEQYVEARAQARSRGVEAVYAAASVEERRHSFCPMGRDTLIVAPDGTVNACYLLEEEWRSRGLDLSLGRCDPGEGMQLDPRVRRQVRRRSASRTQCAPCFARWHCAGGCHVNHAQPGGPGSDDAFCVQTRLISVFRLLELLGQEEEMEELLRDRRAQEKIAARRSDLVEEWADAEA